MDNKKDNENSQKYLPFPVIEHPVEKIDSKQNTSIEKVNIDQRANDGYINATALCKACGKEFGDYNRLSTTKAFLEELSSDMGIPISELVNIIIGGIPQLQGTWVHPQVAINLGQWASPKFAVLVSKWVFEWMTGKQKKEYNLPYHIRRYLINRSKIPVSHFSMLDEMTLKLVAPLEHYGYTLPDKLMPDISMGKMFSKWCRDNGHDPDSFPTYEHIFDDGKRPPVQARLYPNELLTSFREMFNNHWLKEKSINYFKERDSNMIPILEQIISELPSPIEKKEIS
jgi:hypothetical protein